jgi:hypothetical protein
LAAFLENMTRRNQLNQGSVFSKVMYFIHLSQVTAREMILHMAFIRAEYVKTLWNRIAGILEMKTAWL